MVKKNLSFVVHRFLVFCAIVMSYIGKYNESVLQIYNFLPVTTKEVMRILLIAIDFAQFPRIIMLGNRGGNDS